MYAEMVNEGGRVDHERLCGGFSEKRHSAIMPVTLSHAPHFDHYLH